MNVFVTDANYRHALGAIRSLAGHGARVTAGAPSRIAQGMLSRYAKARVVYPSPKDEERFVGFMERFLERSGIDVLLPIGYQSSVVCSKHCDRLSRHAKIPIAPYEAMEIASHKDKTFALAERLGIGRPRVFGSAEEVDRFPVVVKGTQESKSLRYVNSREELARVDAREGIIQEYIPGAGYGFYALYRHGEMRAYFMHRRLREYPITGGASTAAESVHDPALNEAGRALLDTLGWHGVAMVEFKKDERDGRFKLIEINPKFWGSLDLSVAAGVDFPYLAAKMALDGDIDTVPGYQVGVRFRWLFPDEILHLAANPRAFGAFCRDFLDRQMHVNIDLTDPVPTLFQIGETAIKLVTRALQGRLRYPHGVPRMGR